MSRARALLALSLALPLSVAVAAPARAADPTTTAVTSYDGGTFRLLHTTTGGNATVDETPLTVSGTSDGTSGTVDLVCDFGASSHTLTTAVPVGSGGAWTWTGSALGIKGDTCVLRAIPSGTSPTDLTPFTGKVIGVGYDRPYTDGSTLYDYELYTPQRAAHVDYDSASACGLCDWASQDPTTETQGEYSFYGNDFYGTQDTVSVNSTPTNVRSGLAVDGKVALLPSALHQIGGAGFAVPAITHAVDVDPATGNTVISDVEPASVCTASTAFPPTAASCATYVSAGVSLQRTMLQVHDGRAVTIQDTWVSTDGKAHRLDLQQVQDFSGISGKTTGWLLPWMGSTLVPHTKGDPITAAPTGPQTITVVQDPSSPISLTNPVSTITTSSAPTGGLFYDDGFFLDFARIVPAGGSSTMTETFAASDRQAEVDAISMAATAAATPRISVIAPTAGAGQLLVTVTGKVLRGSNSLPTSINVGGTPVPVAADGTFSAPVHLAAGTNTIPLATIDDGGLSTTTSIAVTVGSPLTRQLVKLVKTKFSRGPHKGSLKALSLTQKVTCARTATKACAVTYVLTKGHTVLLRKTFTVMAGSTRTLTLALPSKVLKAVLALKKGKAYATSLTVGTAGFPTTTAPVALKR